MEIKSITNFLRHERKRRGMTQNELAGISGVSPNTIANIEKGNGRIDTLMAIISTWWDDMASFGEDYEYWRDGNE